MKENYWQSPGLQSYLVIKSLISTSLTEPKEPQRTCTETSRQRPIYTASQAPWEWQVLLSTADNQRTSSWLFPVSLFQLRAFLSREAFCTYCVGTGCIQVPFPYLTAILSSSKLSSLKEVLSSSGTKHYFKEVWTTASLFFSWTAVLFNSQAHFK